MIHNIIAFILPTVYAAATLSNSEKGHAGFSIMNSYTDEDYTKISKNIDHDGSGVSKLRQAQNDNNNDNPSFKGVVVVGHCPTGYVVKNGRCYPK